MELFGGTVVPIPTATSQVKAVLTKLSGVRDLALMLELPCHHTDYSNALLFSSDTMIEGDFSIDPEQKWLQKNRIAMVACLGDLTIKGDLLNISYDYWPVLVVCGTLIARNIVKGALPLVVGKDIRASGYVVPQFNDGPLRTGGNLHALGYIHDCPDQGGVKGHLVSGKIDAPNFDMKIARSKAEMKRTFVAEVLRHKQLDIDEVIDKGKSGRSIWLSSEEAALIVDEVSPPPPPVPMLALVNPLTLGKVEQLADMKDKLCNVVKATKNTGPNYLPGYFINPIEWAFDGSSNDQVLVLPPDTVIDGDLLLDWETDWISQNKLAAIVCFGNLAVNGTIRNKVLDGGPMLFVSGDLRADHLVKGGAPILVLGAVTATGIVICEYNHGQISIGRDLTAKACIFMDQSATVIGEIKTPYYVNRNDSDGMDFEDWRDIVVESVFPDEDDEAPSVELMWAHYKANRPIFRQ